MNLTAKLREFAVKHLGVAADADDATFKSAITAALGNGNLTAKNLAALSEESDGSAPDPRKELADIVTQAVVAGIKATQAAAAPPAAPAPEPEKSAPATDEFEKRIDALVEKRMAAMGNKGGHSASFASQVMGKAAMSEPRVKGAVESYTHARTAAIYPSCTKSGRRHQLAGQPVMVAEKSMDMPSTRDKAVMGAVLKWQLLGSISGGSDPAMRLSEHERDLVHYALENEKWSGPVGCKGNPDQGEEFMGKLLTKDGEYALINDVQTGGAYAIPEIWDDAVVLQAVLFGELFPFVEVVNLPKGSFVHGMMLATDPVIWPPPGSTATEGHGFYGDVMGGTAAGLGRAYSQVTMEGDIGSGSYEEVQEFASPATGTSLTGSGYNYLQDMSGVVGHFDNGIYPTVAAMEVGLDWESDTPLAFGNLLVERMGIKTQEWLDAVIAIGSGYNQPLGLFSSGTGGIAVTPTNAGSQGPIVVADLEKLLFGISKAMRASKGGKNYYVMNDSQYRLCRSIPWFGGGAATAQARAFGMDHEKYELFDHPVKIYPSIPNGQMAFCNLAYYRMYRRLGMQIRMSSEGQSLMLKNTRLIVGRSRWGGKLTQPLALALMTSAQYPSYGFPAAQGAGDDDATAVVYHP